MEDSVSELQALDAVAAEHGAVLAFRLCEEADGAEPVFARIEHADAGAEGGAMLISLTDRNGLSLGRYVMPRGRLEAALADAVAERGEPVG